MAKSTSCKEAIANFEKAKGVVAAEAEKVHKCPKQFVDQSASWSAQTFLAHSSKHLIVPTHMQVLLFGQVPPIDKMDASLSALKACK